MKEFKCGTCGNKTDVCYTDAGTLGMVHGFCQCRDCYSIEHPLCPMCNDLTSKEWDYCAHCGAFLGANNRRVCPTKNYGC